jgi:hypothetical protein
MPHNALLAIGQPLFAETGNKGIRFRHQRFGKHTARSLARDLR